MCYRSIIKWLSCFCCKENNNIDIRNKTWGQIFDIYDKREEENALIKISLDKLQEEEKRGEERIYALKKQSEKIFKMNLQMM